MKNDLIDRTFNFSNKVIDLVEILPNSQATKVINYQLLKSGTSVGANYRASQRARSDREFLAKINIVLEEIDESLFWLQIIKFRNWTDTKIIDTLANEANELTAIFVSISKKIRIKINNEGKS